MHNKYNNIQVNLMDMPVNRPSVTWMSEQEKNSVNHTITHNLNNNLDNEQYCFLQIQIWPNTKIMPRVGIVSVAWRFLGKFYPL